jgi:hypothetical protein
MAKAVLGKPTSPNGKAPQSVRDLIDHWMREWIWRGFPTDEAADKTLEEIRTAGLIDAFIDEFGAFAIAHVWREGQRIMRMVLGDGTDTTRPVGQNESPTARVRARERLSRSTTLFDEMVFKVASRWVRLGDIRKADAGDIAAKYEGRERGAARAAAVWRGVEADLGDDETVRNHYTEDAIKEILASLRDEAQ